MIKILAGIIIILGSFIFFGRQAQAGTISSAKDTITTSRPSAATSLTANQAASATQVTIYDNKSIFLASDSAVLLADTGETENTVNVASMSAVSASARTLYFTNTAANTHHIGDTITTRITAMHTVQFTIPSAVPASGKIILTFPGTAVTAATPSATTFSFNGLTTAIAAANISYRLVSGGARTCTFAVATAGQTPTITCTVDAGGALAASSTITFLIGCADTSADETSCTAQSPRLINPTKTATAGTADIWKLQIDTQDASSNPIDNAIVSIGTIDSVQVQATVDPTLTFSIAGVTNGSAVNTGNTTGCTQTETTNAGLTPDATSVNLGVLGTTTSSTGTKISNIAAQLITITTNGANGYTLTATASGHLVNPANGFYLQDSTTPAVFPSGTDWFGLHACGLDTYGSTPGTTYWNSTASDTACNTYITGSTGNICKYGWPTQTSAITLASDSTGPIGNSLTTGNGLVSVSYAGGVDAGVPTGTYTTVVTYVATPTF